MNVELLAEIIRARGNEIMPHGGSYDARSEVRYEVASALLDLASDVLAAKHRLEGNR